MVRGRSRFGFVVLFAAGALATGEMNVSIAGAGPSQSVAAPAEMFEDGIDAIDDHRPDLAVKIFETLQSAYPQSAEAHKAAAEIAKLKSDVAPKQPDHSSRNARPSIEVGASDEGAGRRAGEAPNAIAPDGSSSDDMSPDDAALEDGAVGVGAGTVVFGNEQLRKLSSRFLAEVGDRVFFAENSATIGGRARAILEAQARWMKTFKGIDMTIIGRAADGGSKDDSFALSLARAKAVEAKLIAAGVPPERLKIDARGVTDPVATCDSAMCQAQNRHVETLLRLPNGLGVTGKPQVLGGAGDTTDRTAPR
ncbi:MAG: OmpA family protein, partial [Hyphomicrobium sp.]